MTGDGFDDPGRPRGHDPRRAHRSCRPLWLGGIPEPERSEPGPGEMPGWGSGHGPRDCDSHVPHDSETCEECAAGAPGPADPVPGGDPDPDLGEIVVILLVSTLAGLRDRLERDGFESAAGLVHDLVEVADDYVMRFQP